MDRAPRQVMIEAHVLEIRLKDDFRHGVNYKHALQLAKTSVEFDVTGFVNPLATPAVFARIHGHDVNALLECLKATTDAKTLASPRVSALNGQKARIQIGEQLGYRVVTVTQTSSIEDVKFLELGVVLEVTPRITDDNRILMHVSPKVSSGQINPDTQLPEEKTTTVETDVHLCDGQGIVIGGLIQERDITSQSKLPWLGDLRWVGKLFQKNGVNRERTEIVVALVPHIMHEGGAQLATDYENVERCQTRLFHGPLERTARPWEPRMPDAVNCPVTLWPRRRLLRRSQCCPEDAYYPTDGDFTDSAQMDYLPPDAPVADGLEVPSVDWEPTPSVSSH
jgi:type II secretory pathway component GspD/PulD (secretin)